MKLSQVPLKERTPKYWAVGEPGPRALEQWLGQQPLRSNSQAELKAVRGIRQLLCCAVVSFVLQGLLTGFVLFSPVDTFTYITKQFGI